MNGITEHELDAPPKIINRRHIDIILMEPQKSENIGATARAMANMGLGRLVLVRPRTLNQELMEATATSHAVKFLNEMSCHQELAPALAPYGIVVGTTARLGNQRGPFYTPRKLSPELLPAPGDSPTPVAILFGPERTGLSTEDLRLCQKVVRIPTDEPETSSLNLAQAVLILGYELLMAARGVPEAPAVKPAPHHELTDMYEDLKSTLIQIDFLPSTDPEHWLMNVKKIFNRSHLTSGECKLWRGICRKIRWAMGRNVPPPSPPKLP